MRDSMDINIICPNCKLRVLTIERYASRGNCHTWRRIRCINPGCNVDTGQQSTLSDAFQVLMAEYYGAAYNGHYEIKIEDGDIND